jgi:hypothetical protein
MLPDRISRADSLRQTHGQILTDMLTGRISDEHAHTAILTGRLSLGQDHTAIFTRKTI